MKKSKIHKIKTDLVELYKNYSGKDVIIDILELPKYDKYYYDLKRDIGFSDNKNKKKVYRFYFKSKINMKKFTENPKFYLPKYGGFPSYMFLKNNQISFEKKNVIGKYISFLEEKKSLFFFENIENMNIFIRGAIYQRVNSLQECYISLKSLEDAGFILEEAKKILEITPKNSSYYHLKEKNISETEELCKMIRRKSFCNLDHGEDYLKSHFQKITDQRWKNIWGDLDSGPININY